MANGPTRKNPLAKFGVRLDDFDKLPEVNQGVNEFMDEVVDAWKNNSPVGTGAYRDSVQVTERSTNKGRGKVGATDPQAHLVEFGSAHNDEYAPAQKTAKQFGGTAYGD
ncbi:hypothetical protein GUMBIE_9 [Mycobacterium phage GUmbie]|uniref:Head-to-tail connector protein n=4 Tax=Cheoctovirus TaxID=1623281 RepID=Q855K1_9CAUD|nr:hypothetical protein PBI_CHE8_9 [Mycobacterium phage Che8]YP_009018885.1 head-tail connector protein [Mycobacterium phage GUmbie]YP_009125188.1 head-tail connector protein [Mycobacterium phage Hades]YP_009963099.1 head-tail connector protein [Mycobacterium phage Veteran]UJE15562.1 hypothetical protein SEA_MADIBA_10 [Mycobacterium phage Madiba]WKW86636.1 hypothetical protein SEA_KARHDO_9 [Mycobacterium phage Karhdo]AAN12407.1 hypothetical protein PBI_CHE8_9 [Mycobacterium phage Che8]AEL200